MSDSIKAVVYNFERGIASPSPEIPWGFWIVEQEPVLYHKALECDQCMNEFLPDYNPLNTDRSIKTFYNEMAKGYEESDVLEVFVRGNGYEPGGRLLEILSGRKLESMEEFGKKKMKKGFKFEDSISPATRKILAEVSENGIKQAVATTTSDWIVEKTLGEDKQYIDLVEANPILFKYGDGGRIFDGIHMNFGKKEKAYLLNTVCKDLNVKPQETASIASDRYDKFNGMKIGMLLPKIDWDRRDVDSVYRNHIDRRIERRIKESKAAGSTIIESYEDILPFLGIKS